MSRPNRSNRNPRGRSHLVLLLPGFSVGDWSNTAFIVPVLRAGAVPMRWRLGSNEGPTERVLAGLEARLSELYALQERKVSLVGMSLGGVFARRLGRSHPDMVRQVITVGAPFRFGNNTKPSPVQRMWNDSLPRFVPEAVAEINQDEETKPPLTMPTTSIYSRADDIVAWNRSLNSDHPNGENIEVRGATHLGLLVHPGVHLALADRIGQPEDRWQPFRPPPLARPWFRPAPYFDPDRAGRASVRLQP